MIVKLPTVTNLARYSFEIELDNVDFKFDFEWSERAGHWIMGLADSKGTVLVSGRRIVLGLPLLSRYRDTRLPKGLLLAFDTSGTDTEPGFADLGDRVQLLYVELADVPRALLIDVG